ncbi:uncharacterized protein LOC129739252 isoform X2 [Uranotaenia lowii]|uniref:uncharacterized protein LOC129739252 isoform X2 n=1 Tax=Uranotaenia lowii TaxID=190385 RepID=UPI002479757A|nr:uncharacterized protein LOC129739252 isoform X2 [Uranotaenia lowii]
MQLSGDSFALEMSSEIIEFCNVEVELLEETPVDQPLMELLSSFGLSESAMNIMLSSGYTIDGLKIIQRNELEELLQPPLLLDRSKVIEGLNRWRVSLNLVPVTTPLTSKSSCSCGNETQLLAIENRQRHEWTAKSLIQRSSKDDFKEQFGRLTKPELQRYASDLKFLFPTVDEYFWYRPSFYYDSNGKKIKLGRLAKGSLHDRNNNYKLTSKEKATATISSDSEFLDISITDDQIASYNNTKQWLRHNLSDWDELKSRWSCSSSVRLYEISRLIDRTFSIIFLEYPALRSSSGYQLVQLDFNFKYPGKGDLLFSGFKSFRLRAKPIFLAENGRKKGVKDKIKWLDEELSEDVLDCTAVQLLFGLWPCPLITLPTGNRWKPSIQESTDSMIRHISSLSEFESLFARIAKENASRGNKDTPVILIVGDTLKSLDHFYVSFGDVTYKAENFLKALDIILKLHVTYGVPFPRETSAVWEFISLYFYDISVQSEPSAKIVSFCETLRVGMN